MPRCSFKVVWADWRGRLPYRRYLDREDRPRRLAAQAFSLVTLILGSVYLVWLAGQVGRTREAPDYFFLAAEFFAFFLLAILGLDLWRRRYHRPEGLPLPEESPTVDIFVPTCGEPLPVLRTTLEAVARIDYHPKTVYVLDDADSPAVETLALSLHCHYLSRIREGLSRQDAKGGNLNFGLERSAGELILVLDADQVPTPDILTRTVGFFRFPQIAFVQTKQSFLLPDGDPFFNRDEIFYEVVQCSNDQVNAVISCGSGVVYRRQALMEMGGFATWNLVEDFTTSYELVSRGWKGLYFPYALSRGLAPATLAGVYRQRFQWAVDTMRLFFWDNPLWKRGLRWRQKFHFLLIMVSYLVSGLVLPIFYLVPLISYWQGYSCLRGSEWQYLGLRGIFVLATVLMFRYLFHGKDALKQFKMLCGLFPVYALAILAALFCPPGHKPAYRPNNGRILPTSRSTWLLLTPQLILIVFHLFMPFLSLHLGWSAPKMVVFNAFFSAFTIWVLGDLVLECLSPPTWQPELDPRQVYGFY